MPSAAPIMSFDVGSFRTTLLALEHTETALIEEAGRVAMAEAAQVLLTYARKVLSLTDHSLRDLRRADHPYARRHGRIKVHAATPWKVHTHTGRLLQALRDAPYDVGDMPAHMVYLDTSEAPHARYVVEGTRTMLPRDPLWTGVALQPGVQKKLMTTIVRVMGLDFRTKIGVRFEDRGTTDRTVI